ncbi:MSCRAMM family protein [Actinomycetospora chibensis]|uniref:Collagen binding domain-containing protein n=1 Tax=Actinomycetospora chibensis TaxID=663606 RepID=A0ABV9RP19_9PSEU|nr:carboxypeptidase-like regulatory domain-containing protein [Actinomycetospora chibensis]MDD7925268.1 carboxypeptidase-like regulatory domain-containing protein [Actinomycetospora chibensis]
MDGQEPIMIFGRVTRSDGAPVPGAALTLCDLSGDQLDRAAADEGGHFQLVPPTGGTYLVICASSTHQPHASLVAVADRPLRHDVGLSGGGASLGGTVGVRHGAGTNGASEAGNVRGWDDVVLTLTDVRGAVVAVTRSGSDGGYRFSDLTEGTYTLTAAAPRLAPVAETVRVPGEGHVTHDVALATRTQLSGTVRSAGAGRPVAEALATLVSEDGHVVGSRVTGEDGSFRFDDVAHGVYTITASGYAPVASEIEIGPGHPSDVVLSLVPPAVDGAPSRPAAPPGGDGAAAGNGDGATGGRHVHHLDTDDVAGTPRTDSQAGGEPR